MNLNKSVFDCSEVGVNTVTLTVLDVNGNSASKTAVVTVEDTINPTILTQDITAQLDANGSVSISAAEIDNGSSDNCSIATMSLDITNFDCSQVGDNTVTLTVTDNNGNIAACTATVKVGDNIKPIAKCNSIEVLLDQSGRYMLTHADINALAAGSSDNIDDYSDLNIAVAPYAFSCVDAGTEVPVIVFVKDKAGNRATCRTFVTVVDPFPIEVSTIADIQIALDPGVCETSTEYPEIVSTNACVSILQTAGLGAGSMFPVGTTTESWIAFNTSGDTIKIDFDVIVTAENALPAIDAVPDQIIAKETKP